MNAIAFPFLADGIPIMYSGGEQGFEGGTRRTFVSPIRGTDKREGDDPFNREPMWHARWSAKNTLYNFISRVVAARNTA